MDALEILLDLASKVERNIKEDEKKQTEPVEKLTRIVAKNEILIMIYQSINDTKENE